MMPFLSNNCLQSVLTAVVYIVVLRTCNSKECELQMTGNIKETSVVFRKMEMKTCKFDCNDDSFIFASCHKFSESKVIEKTGGPSVRSQNQSRIATTFCGRKICNHTSRCVEEGIRKVCVQALSFCKLHNASESGDPSMVRNLLFQEGTDINCKKWIGRTPVMVAAEKGHRRVVQLLVSNGADMSVVDNFCFDILHCASLGGNVELVKYVLSKGKMDINGKVRCGWTPVMLAAKHRHQEVVELLMSKGADMSLLDNKNGNVLHAACIGGDVEVVKYVLAKDTLGINSRGWLRKTPVLIAAVNGHRDVVDLLLKNGADISLVDKRGNNILHAACRGGCVKMVKYVLAQDNVDINSRGFYRKTPIITAATRGHTEVVDLLVREGANMSLVDKGGSNLLYVACRGGHVELVKYILAKGKGGINSRGRQGKTGVVIAAERGHTKVVDLLVRKGADISLVDGRGNNVLHVACREGKVEVVKYVLSHDTVDIQTRNKHRETAADIAKSHGLSVILDLLHKKSTL